MAVPEPSTETGTACGMDAWRPLPGRSRALFLIGTMPITAAIALAAGGVAAAVADRGIVQVALAAAVGALVGLAYGFWLGTKQFRHTFWRLDAEGLGLRRGNLWRSETRVPASRVQHLDLKRGPLQRGRGLATLVVHTAGTRHSAVTIPNLDAGDAERLREHLGRQIDHDDE